MCNHSIRARIARLLLGAVVLIAAWPAAAPGAPSAAQVTADRAALEQALDRLGQARSSTTRIEERLDANSRRLDELLQAQNEAEAALNARAGRMYRTGETTFVAVLMGARTFEELSSGWALLKRITARDAEVIRELKRTRRRAATAARELQVLQTEAVKELEAERELVVAARAELAASSSALAEYERRAAADRRTRTPAAESASAVPEQGSADPRTGSGAWSTAVASHYGRNFSGNSASGTRIGPSSMICAHKTLPFGTLVEFEYRGKRAVATVVDRGPFTAGRTFDLGPGIVRALDFEGVDTVRYRVIGR